jgi:hypothetical protein
MFSSFLGFLIADQDLFQLIKAVLQLIKAVLQLIKAVLKLIKAVE